MSEYPPGSFGYLFDALDADLARLERTSGIRAWPLRVWARSRRRKLAAYRESLRRQVPARLEAAGFLTAEQRERLEQLG